VKYSLVQVCLLKGIGQNGTIHLVPAKCDQITCASKSARSIDQNGITHLVPAKSDQITCTSMLGQIGCIQ